MRLPIASPSHHTLHSGPKPDQSCTPPRHRLVTPIVALTAVLNPAASTTSPNTSFTRLSEPRNPIRLSSQAPTTASSIFPTAMPHAVSTGSFAVTFAANAPSKIPGQTRKPRISRAASATPVGGQTAVTCSATSASERPSLADAK